MISLNFLATQLWLVAYGVTALCSFGGDVVGYKVFFGTNPAYPNPSINKICVFFCGTALCEILFYRGMH